MNFDQNALFPILVLYTKVEMDVYETADGLCICSIADLKAGSKGRYAKSEVVDSNGLTWDMDGAEKLHGVGRFWGYNLFLNRIIRVRPKFVGEPKQAHLEDIRSEVLKRLACRNALSITLKRICSIIDKRAALKLVPQIRTADSIQQIIAVLISAEFPERIQIENK